MIIMGIETSCDETSVAILDIDHNIISVKANVISSQIALHAPHGGVVPVLAAREHVKNIGPVLNQAIKESGVDHIDLIAVTSGPGLISSLLVGDAFAQTYAWKNQIPLIGVNHMEGHIYSNWLEGIKLGDNVFPALCLIVSGGHTELILIHDYGKYELVGRTVDDAAGEAFDKIARILELGYPGGPAISELAASFNPDNKKYLINLPRPMLRSGDYQFSFSGLKTAVLYLVRDLLKNNNLADIRQEVAHEAQEAIVDTLVAKTKSAAQAHNVKNILLAGGVSANKLLRARLKSIMEDLGINCHIPALKYTTDNAAMIAMAGYMASRDKDIKDMTWDKITTNANWEIV